MHCKNIVHRDLKLDNILINLQNHIAIWDLGSAKKITNQNKNNIPVTAAKYYRPPEWIFLIE